MMNDWQQMVALGIMAVGTVALIWATVLIQRLSRRPQEEKKDLTSTLGTVIDFENRGAADDEVWHPVVEFRAGDQLIQGATDWGTNPVPFLLGSSIPIEYDPVSPAGSIRYAGRRPSAPEPSSAGVRALLILGLLLFAAGLGTWIYTIYG